MRFDVRHKGRHEGRHEGKTIRREKAKKREE
jgi:hypothetical protein